MECELCKNQFPKGGHDIVKCAIDLLIFYNTNLVSIKKDISEARSKKERNEDLRDEIEAKINKLTLKLNDLEGLHSDIVTYLEDQKDTIPYYEYNIARLEKIIQENKAK